MNSQLTRKRRNLGTLVGVSMAVAVLGAACSNESGAPRSDGAEPTAGSEAESAVTGDTDSDTGAPQEAAGPQARLVATYDGGVMTLDADTLEVLDTTELPGFLRVNPAGDGRHVFVSSPEGFRVFDAGTWSEPHGDHAHSYTQQPALTDTVYAGEEPGHVVAHDGKTVLFSDGDGKIQTVTTEDLRDGNYPDADTTEADEAHHGVAVALPDDRMLMTTGDADSRNGAKVVDADGAEIASTEECPGVHGEAPAAGGRIALGCEDGIIVWDGQRFEKIESPDDYGRIGNQKGSEDSAIVLGDYKVDPDAELERPERISLTDAETGTLRLVDIGTSYSFRSLERGPDGEALVLGTDGALHVIDPQSGEETEAIDVISQWREPSEWQEARPTVFSQGESVFVSEPDKKLIHAVDLASGEVTHTVELPHAPNELSGVNGDID